MSNPSSPASRRILIVEDEAITAMDLAMELEQLGYEVCGTADTVGSALEEVKEKDPHLVLMDIRLGEGGDGVEAAEQILAQHDTAVVFLTAHSDEATLARALAVSPFGYIVKPFRARDLKIAVELALSKNAQDLRKQEEVGKLLLTDPLTGLGNRRKMDEALAVEWDRGAREGKPLGVLMIDIDHFKAFNDRYGHPAGDHCLEVVSRAILGHCDRPGDIVCRWGGEEFLVLLSSTDAAGADHVASDIVRVIRQLGLPHEGSPTAPTVTVSVGVASATPSPHGAVARLVERADQALYAAKGLGRNQFCRAAPENLPASCPFKESRSGPS